MAHSQQALGSDGVRVTMESALTARDRVGVQDFVLLENFTSEAAFIENLRRRFRENLIYVRPEWEDSGAAGGSEAGLRGKRHQGPLGENSDPPPPTPRPTSARSWSLSTPTGTSKSTAGSTWSVTVASASTRCHPTCE